MSIAALPALLAFGHIGDSQDPAYIVGPGFFDSESGNMQVRTIGGVRVLRVFQNAGNPTARMTIPSVERFVIGMHLAMHSGGIGPPWIDVCPSGMSSSVAATRIGGFPGPNPTPDVDGSLAISGPWGSASDSSVQYFDGTLRYVELAVYSHDSAGSIQVRVDGVEVISVTGIDTSRGTVDQLRFQGGNTFASGEWIAAANIYIKEWDSPSVPGFLGEMEATHVPPDDDVAAEWAPDSGVENYSRLIEAAIDDDTSYVGSSADADVDQYSHPGPVGVSEQIYAVTQYSVGKLVSGASTIQHGLKASGDEVYGSALTQKATYGTEWTHQFTPPQGGNWTEAKVNACDLLWKHNTANEGRVTKAGFYVWEQLSAEVERPSIVSATPTAVGAELTGSTFESNKVPAAQLQSATWRVYSDAAGSTLIFELEVDYGDAHPTDPSVVTVGGVPGTSYWATVEYEDDEGTTSGVSGLFQFTTLAADPPDPPSLTVDEIAEDSARFTLSAYSHPDDDGLPEPQPWSHASSRIQIVEQSGSFAAPFLDFTWYGGAYPLNRFHTQDVLGPAGTLWKARAQVQDNRGSWSVFGAEKQFQALDGSTARPGTPTVTIDSFSAEGDVAAHTDAFSAGDGGSHDATRWVVEDASGNVVYDQIVDSGDLINLAVLIAPGSACVYAYHREDNGVWSARSACASISIPAGGGFWFPEFTNPLDAHLLVGTVNVTYELQNEQSLDAGAHFELQVSQDMGVNWTPLVDDDKTGSYELDTTLYDDVPTLLRVRVALDSPGVGATSWTTAITGFKNDAAWDLEVTNDTMQADGGFSAFDGRYWHDSGHGIFGPEEPDYGLARQNSWSSPASGLVVLRRTAARVLREGTVMGRVMIDGPPTAGFPWQHGYWQEFQFGGIASNVTGKSSLGDALTGIAVHIYMFPVSLGPVFHNPANTGSGRITIELRESGLTHSRATPKIGNFYGKLIRAYGGWYGVGGTYDEFPDREPWYGIAMNVIRTDNGDGTEDVRVRVRITGAWAHYLDGQLDGNGWHMDETFSNVVLPCGEPGFCGYQQSARFGAFFGWAWYEAMAVQVDVEDECSDCPEPPECVGTPNAAGGAVIAGTPLS